ncbi:radical SAM protein, partial [Candidatus Magnetomorum sp. HK-1]
MKVCLLNPPKFQKRLNNDIIINFNVARFSRGVDLVFGTTPPTELAILASEISKKHQVFVLDANADNMLPREVNRWIFNKNPDFFIIKCGDTTLLDDLSYYYFAEGIGIKTIVWEDMLNPIFSNELINKYHIKRIMYGEPERIINNFFNGKTGLIGGDFIPDLNKLPQPLFSKLPMKKYYKEGRSNWYSFLSRGCGWGKCEFCLMADKNIPHRLRSLDHIKEELDILKKYNIQSIYFWDPQFNPDIQRAKEVSNLLLSYNFKWECWFRCDHFDEELFKLMKKSGCFRI